MHTEKGVWDSSDADDAAKMIMLLLLMEEADAKHITWTPAIVLKPAPCASWILMWSNAIGRVSGVHLYKGQSCDHESVVNRFCLIHLNASSGGIDLQLYATVPTQQCAIQDQVLGLHMLLVTALAPKPCQPPAADRVQFADLSGGWRQSLGL